MTEHLVQPVFLEISVAAESLDTPDAAERRVIQAVRRANTAEYRSTDDLVAVKVQYSDALKLFIADLGNIRRLASFLSKTELAFDLVSAVDELSSQVKLEFDFHRYSIWQLHCECCISFHLLRVHL